MTLGALVFEGGLPEEGPVVHAGDVRWDRRELVRQASLLADELSGLGVSAGVPVGAMLPNSAELVAAMFGVWRAGGVYVPINPNLSRREIEHVLESVRPCVVVTTVECAARLPGVASVVTGSDGWSQRPGRRLDSPVHGDDVAAVVFTSGTTGPPKPVLIRHSGVLGLMDGVIRRLRGGGGDRTQERDPMPNLIPVSLSVWAGIYNVLFAFRVGAPVVVMERFGTRAFAGLVRRFGIRSTVLPPAAMTMLVEDASVTDLSPLRLVRSISAPLSPLQARRFRDRFGVLILNGYGQTEIGGEVVGWDAADLREWGDDKLGSVGRPHEGVEVRVARAGEAGELLVRTPWLSAGYADGGDIGDRLDAEGWFHTGDVARVDADGFVWIEGRLSDMINRGGLKVFPAEVEEVLRLSPRVADAAVVGVPDDRLGEVPWAFVVAEGSGPDPTELDRLCRSELVAYKVPVRIDVVPELPRNEAGKVIKSELERRATRVAK